MLGQGNSLKEFAENTSLHGARYLCSGSKFRKFVWWLAITGSLIYCGVQMFHSVSHYLRRPFGTVITVERKSSLVFPAITICSFNLVNLNKLKNLQPPGTDMSNLEKQIAQITGKAAGDCNDRSKRKDDVYHPLFYQRGNFILHILNSTGNNLEGMLSLKWPSPCLWKGKPCGPQNFTTIFNTR